jgi:hypothetical protein
MSEQWDQLQEEATGEWQIFLGQDDCIMDYFFDLLENLTALAKNKNIKLINSRRAYFFWPGSSEEHKKIFFSFKSHPSFSIKKTSTSILLILTGLKDYFDFSQMYTTSLFHRDLISQIRLRQNGKLFITHPQDANLAALACVSEKYYLHSRIPLGVVGTSISSAGLAINALSQIEESAKNINDLAETYLNKILKSPLSYLDYAGKFTLGSGIVYFWQALIQVRKSLNLNSYKWVEWKIFKFFLFFFVFYEINKNKISMKTALEFKDLLEKNSLERFNNLFKIGSIFLSPIYQTGRIITEILSRMRKELYLSVENKVMRKSKFGLLELSCVGKNLFLNNNPLYYTKVRKFNNSIDNHKKKIYKT